MGKKFDEALIFKGTDKEEIVESNELTKIRIDINNGNSKPTIFSRKTFKPEPIDLTSDVYCPECKKPLLTVTSTYLKTRNNQNHVNNNGNICTYNFDNISNTSLNELFKDDINKDKIINKINNLSLILSKIPSKNDIKTKQQKINTSETISEINNSLLITYKNKKLSIPQQKLKHNFIPKYGINNLILYYGKVYITQSQNQKDRDKETYSIRVLNNGSLDHICSLTFELKYNYFDKIKKNLQNNLSDEKTFKPINLVMFGNFTEYNGYYTIDIKDSRYISIT